MTISLEKVSFVEWTAGLEAWSQLVGRAACEKVALSSLLTRHCARFKYLSMRSLLSRQ